MKISVITPSYNQGRFIERCLASVSAQKGDFAVEHIVMDNCSTDGSVDVIRHHQALSTCVEFRATIEADKGQTDAINKGLALATGDIVCWLNTDEWYEPGALACVVDFFSNHPEIDVVFGDCDFVDTDGKLVKKKREHFFSKSMLIFYGCFIPSCSTFVRRRVVDDGILLSPEFKVTMDLDWYVRMAQAGYCFSHIPATIACFTWHENNISSTFVDRRRFEKRLVQDRYSGVPGPRWFRTIWYGILLRLWLAIRVITRSVAA